MGARPTAPRNLKKVSGRHPDAGETSSTTVTACFSRRHGWTGSDECNQPTLPGFSCLDLQSLLQTFHRWLSVLLLLQPTGSTRCHVSLHAWGFASIGGGGYFCAVDGRQIMPLMPPSTIQCSTNTWEQRMSARIQTVWAQVSNRFASRTGVCTACLCLAAARGTVLPCFA